MINYRVRQKTSVKRICSSAIKTLIGPRWDSNPRNSPTNHVQRVTKNTLLACLKTVLLAAWNL